MPFDRVTLVGTSFVACTYDVDVRAVHGEDAARRLLSETRERVKAGRALKPDAAHYVNVIAADPVDDSVRRIVLPELGQNDGIDAVAVFGLALLAAPAPKPWTDEERASAGDAWARMSDAIQADAVLVGRVVESAGDEVRVDVDGAVGLLVRWVGEAPPKVGDTIRVRAVVLNLKQRRVEFVEVRE